MRLFTRLYLLAAFALLWSVQTAQAVPRTGFGPGGFEDDADGIVGTNGSALVLWFRSDRGLYQDLAGTIAATANNDPVSRWNDLSDYGRNMTPFGANPLAPTLQLNQINGRPVVQFNNDTGGGFPSSLRTPSFTLNQPESVWSTHAFRGGDNVNPTVWDGFNGNQMRLYGTGGTASTAFNMYAGAGLNGAVGAVNTFHNLGALYSGASSTFRTDGNQVATGNVSTSNAGGLSLGGGVWGAGQGADVDHAEIFVFNRALNSAERIIIDNYQSSHSGLAFAGAVAANDHYLGDTLGNGNYDFAVFGVGDDGTSEVNNAGMDGFGVEVSDGSLGSNEWVFAGHLNTANTIVSLEDNNNPDTVGERWDRVWYLDKTATDGVNATLGFDFEDSGLATPLPGSSFHLLYSADNNFADGWQILGETFTQSGGTVTFDLLNANMLDGYYTLAINIGYVPEPNSMLILLGVLGCGMLRRRKTRSQG
jgi:hypothetical protein